MIFIVKKKSGRGGVLRETTGCDSTMVVFSLSNCAWYLWYLSRVFGFDHRGLVFRVDRLGYFADDGDASGHSSCLCPPFDVFVETITT